MTLASTINQHVLSLPLDKQEEILDFVLFLKQRTTLTTPVEINDTHQSQAVATLLATLDKAKNQNPVGRLNREELYERTIFS